MVPRLNWQMNQRMNEPIFGLLLFATLSLLDPFFPSGLLLRKKSFSTTLHVVFPCYLSSFKVLGWFLPVTPFSRNRHLRKTQTEFQCFVHLEIFFHIFANQRKEESLATPFFCKAYVPFGAPFGAQQWKFPSSVSIFVAFLY